LLAIFALTFTDRRNAAGAKVDNSRARTSKLLLAAIIAAVLLSVQFTLFRILDRFATDPLQDVRIVFAHNTIAAAKAFMPFGSGSGSFVPVYQLFEKPSDTLANTYVNHAHNDMLELWLETGAVGLILLGLFVIWLGSKSLQWWWRPPEVRALDCALARTATVVIALLLAHSLVDYPMRTEAIMAVFAICCALLIEPLGEPEARIKSAASLERHLAGLQLAPKVPALTATTDAAAVAVPDRDGVASRPHQRGGRWGKDMDWPEEWRDAAEPARQINPKSDASGV
jgi:O-Antigen ligase